MAANAFLTYSLATNLGHARNIIIAHSADGLIAVDGSYGTISEAAIALKLRKAGGGTESEVAVGRDETGGDAGGSGGAYLAGTWQKLIKLPGA